MNERLPGRELPPPSQPIKVAEVLVKGFPPLVWWNRMLYRHTGPHWERTGDDTLPHLVYAATRAATWIDHSDEKKTKAWNPNQKTVSYVVHAIKHGLIHRDDARPIDRVAALRNGVVQVGADRSRTLLPHTPAVFNLNSRPFDYDLEARCPAWEAFLEQVLPDERDRHTLQEFFGYLQSHETDRQVMLSLSGQKRAGKGTIVRIMRALTGEENAAAGSLKSLSSDFGLEPLLGKSLLTFGDVRWNIDTAAEAVKLLLEISGEDAVPVNVKGRPILTATLGVRVVFAGNHIPRVNDPSGAFASRLICLSFNRSFSGNEDTGLTARLKAELPGIFNWALDGADRLAAQGRFTISPQGAQLRAVVEDSGRGAAEFIEDYLAAGTEDDYIFENDIVEQYGLWAEARGRKRDSTTADTLRTVILENFPQARNDRNTRRARRIEGKPRRVRAFQFLRWATEEDMPGLPEMAEQQREAEQLFD